MYTKDVTKSDFENLRQIARSYSKKMGDKMLTLRMSKGMSQAEIAKIAGVSQGTYFKYESGEIVKPVASTLRKIATALGTNSSYLLDRQEKLPEKIFMALKEEDFTPFLVKAYEEYKAYKIKLQEQE